jgi:hypothetical protein
MSGVSAPVAFYCCAEAEVKIVATAMMIVIKPSEKLFAITLSLPP